MGGFRLSVISDAKGVKNMGLIKARMGAKRRCYGGSMERIFLL